MQAWVFYSCQTFTSLEMHPPAFRHANAYDQGTAYGTSSLEGGAIADRHIEGAVRAERQRAAGPGSGCRVGAALLACPGKFFSWAKVARASSALTLRLRTPSRSLTKWQWGKGVAP